MSFNSNEDALNFLLDEFFIYHGLEDLEKYSKNQENDLGIIMQNTYELINEIKKIKSNIHNVHVKKKLKSCTYNNSFGNIKNKIPNKIDKNKIRKLKTNDINAMFKQKYLHKSSLKSNGPDSDIINGNKSKNKNIINLRRQYSLYNYTNNETVLSKYNKNYLSVRNIKTENKPKEKNKSKNKSIKHFTISLLD